MANFASILGTYSGQSGIGQAFSIQFDNSAGGGPDVTLTWTCVAIRSNAYEITQGANASEMQINASSAINADISNHGQLSALLNVTSPGSDWKIEANVYDFLILEDSVDPGTLLTLTETPEVKPTKNFELTGYSLDNAVAPCADIEVTITENDGVSPYTWISPSLPSTTLVQDIARQATNNTISITLEDADTDQATLNNVVIPRLFTASEISSISVVANAGGFDATVTVFMVDLVTFSSMTYSLDGSTFQSSTIFPNVVDGSYTLYVNDGYGCIITQGFTVDTAASVQRPNAYAIVPKANSFRFIQLTSTVYNTLENTLYQDLNYLGEYKPFYAQPYQTNDGIITTQFRTNYDELSARLLDCDSNIIDTLSVIKKTDNIGAQDKRDCIAFNYGNNQTGIYFTNGNIYDPGTTDIIDTYELNGQLPEWGVIGNTMVLSTNIVGSFVIKQVLFDLTLKVNILVIDYSWTSGNQSESVIAEVTYDRLPYDNYEFDLDLGQDPLLNGTYTVQILLTDSLDEYPALTFNSEWITIKNEHLRTNFIDYSDSPNSGIDYTTGYTGRIRIRSLDPYANLTPGGESTEYNDSLLETVKLKDVPTMEGEFFFESQPRYMIEKLRLIFSHKDIEINGEAWINIDALDTINFDKSALKNATIKLRRKGYEEAKTQNIFIDGLSGTIDQETGPILQ